EHVMEGGLGSAVLEYNAQQGGALSVQMIGMEGKNLTQGDHGHLLQDAGLDEATLIQRIRASILAREAEHGQR
ncbi:MAG: hypothetical protein VB041_06550, partial [Candidatus Limiplasma sp.]|nr:hypothetical protein [Candidatus Limiplasma sp.]